MTSAQGVGMTACAGCGEAFVCGARAGLSRCWCMDKPIVAPAVGAGSEARCYCARCLEQKISAQSAQGA